VTTPGRLLDHASHTANITFNRVKWLVLDEADRLTDMGYEKDVAKFVIPNESSFSIM
jgi:ATP-dependent RNA helicase DDX31/DBP7